MTMNVNSLLCLQCYACCDHTAEAGITRFLFVWEANAISAIDWSENCHVLCILLAFFGCTL